MRTKPMSTEYPEYYGRYISLVPDGEIEEILHKQQSELVTLFSTASEETASESYAPGKWTLKEVVGHMSDTERVMSYRMLAMARKEVAPLQGMDQDAYVAAANFNQFAWKQLIADFETVRSSTLSLLSLIDDAAWTRQGIVWDSSVSTRAFAYIIAGHALHHMQLIRERYLSGSEHA